MAAVSGTLGGQPVVLDNMASEETLKKILAALQKNAKDSTAGGPAGPAKGPGLGSLAKEAGAVGKSMGVLGKVAGMAGGGVGFIFKALGGVLGGFLSVLGTAVGAVFDAGKAIAQLAMKAFDGEVRMSDFFGAFKDLPVIGVVAGLFEQLAKIQEANLDAFRKMAKTGIGFEGNLQNIRSSALQMGLSLDSFVNVMNANKDVFVGLSGDVETGARQFVQFNKTLRDSQAGSNLRALGMNAEESANAMANFIRNNGGLTAAQKKDYTGVANSVAEYAKQTDRLAKLTGQSAEEIEKKMAKEAQDEAWQATLQGMDEKDREAANEALKVAMATGGQGAVDALKARMMGLPPMTEAGQKFVAMSGNASKRLAEMEAVTKSNMSAEQKRQKLEELGAMLQLDRAKDADAIGIQTLQALAAQGDQNAVAMLKASNDMKKAGVTTYEGALENLKKSKDAQESQMKSQAQMAADAENNLKNMGQMVQALLDPILSTLQPLMSDMIKTFTEFVSGPNGKQAMAKFGEFIAELIKGIMKYSENLLSKEGREKIMNDVKTFFQGLWIDIKRAIAKMMPLGIGSLFYSENDAKKDHEALEKRREIEDKRAELGNERAKREAEFNAAALAVSKDGIESKKKDIADNQAKLKELNDKSTKDMSVEQKNALQKEKDRLEEAIKKDSELTKQAEELKKAGTAEEINRQKKALDDSIAAKEADLKNQEAGGGNAGLGRGHKSGRAGGSLDATGSLLEDFGSGTDMTLHGKEGVITEKQLANLAKGMGGGNQDALVTALQTLNMQTERLIALNTEMAKHQRQLVNKMAWTGNLFE